MGCFGGVPGFLRLSRFLWEVNSGRFADRPLKQQPQGLVRNQLISIFLTVVCVCFCFYTDGPKGFVEPVLALWIRGLR